MSTLHGNPYIDIVKDRGQGGPSYQLKFDGGAVPNPGRAGSAAVIYSPTGILLYECGEYIPHATNNTAEYGGLICGLKLATKKGIRRLLIQGDSTLVINQINGSWAVSNPKIKELHNQVQLLLNNFDYVACRHVYRSHNAHADGLADEIIESRAGFEREAGISKEPAVRFYEYDEALWRIKMTLDGVFTTDNKEAIAEIRAILERTHQ